MIVVNVSAAPNPQLLAAVYAGDDPKLTRITPIIEEATMDIWVLIHPDLRVVRRIDALKDLLIGIFDNRGKVPIAANKKITHNYLTNMVGPAGLNRAA